MGMKSKNAAHKSSFNQILSNQCYLGVYVYQNIRIPEETPTTASMEEFDAVKVGVTKKPPKKRHPGRSIIPQYYMLTGKEIRMQRISSLQKNTGTRLGGFRCFLCLNIFEVKHYSSVSTQPSSQRRHSIMKDASTLCPESTG